MVIQGGSERRRSVARAALLLGVLSGVLACTDDPESEGASARPGDMRVEDSASGRDDGTQGWVARVGPDTLTLEELEAPLAIGLYELEVAAYRLRRARLDAWLESRGSAGGEAVIDRLEKPVPPRFVLPESDTRQRGPDDAVLVVTQFIDFASSHSRRLQPALARVAALAPERVRIEDRQLPLPFHRYARDAAEAARCARVQGAYGAYAEVLLLEQSALAAPDLRRYADRVGMDRAGFEDCLERRDEAGGVDRDLALAQSIGVTRAATIFVNGRYVAGRPDAAALEAIVREELERLGEALGAGSSEVSRSAVEGKVAEGTGPPPVPAALFEDPEFVVTLERAAVRRALEDARSLDTAFDATRAEFGGERLLKLRSVERDGFYDRLGFEAGDVLLAVNGEYVTAARNPLFEALADGEIVRVIVMRRGRPRRFEYRIGEDTGEGAGGP